MRNGKLAVSIVAMAAMSMVAPLAHAADPQPGENLPPPPVQAYYGPDTRDFPQTLAGQVPGAIAQKTESRMLLQRSRSELSGLFTKMRFMHERSDDYQQVARTEKEAFAAYDAARQNALAQLADDEDYKAVVSLRDELGRRITALQRVKGISPESLVPLAEEKLNYSRAASAMETKALANDPAVTQARDRFVEAGTKLALSKSRFEDSLRYHPDVETARVKVEDARVAAVTSAAYSRALVRITEHALDYAYYINRNTKYSNNFVGYGYDGYYGRPYGYYGYGYGR